MINNISFMICYLKLPRLLVTGLFFLLVSFFCLSTYAAVVIWPTNLVMEKNEKIAILYLENRGTTPIVLQSRVYKWQQLNGREELTQQQNVIASPPMMTIAPGSQQLIRIINKVPVLPNEEQTYRLIVDEIPTADKPKTGITFQMRYSLPLFIYGSGLQHNIADGSKVIWRWVNSSGKKWLEFNNSGMTHIYLTNIDFGQKNTEKLSTYVLPHSTIRIAINSKQVSKPQKLTTTINGKNNVFLNQQ